MSVSWLVPVRDGRPWLRACLESILHECGPDDQVVVVDDGSRDKPEEVCPDDSRITWVQQGPLGIVAALETGRLLCRHALIARVDADDLVIPGRIEAQRALLVANDRLAVVGGQAFMVGDHGRGNAGMRAYVDWVNGLPDLRAAILTESPLFHPAVLMRAAALDEVGGYHQGDFPEDYDLWLRLVGAGFELASVKVPVVCLRDHGTRLTRTDTRYRRAAFDGLKKRWMREHLLADLRRVGVWGAGKTGRHWLRWLLAEGVDVVAVVDPFGATERQGVTVFSPLSLRDMELDQMFVAVGARGARALIRRHLEALKPTWIEGRDWWALA